MSTYSSIGKAYGKSLADNGKVTDQSNGVDVKTRILRNTTSIYKRLGLNFKPQRRRAESFEESVKNSQLAKDTVSASDAVLHEPVYSRIASPSQLRQPQAVIPLCTELKTLITPDIERGSKVDGNETCQRQKTEAHDDTDIDDDSDGVKRKLHKNALRTSSWVDEVTATHSEACTSTIESDFSSGDNFRQASEKSTSPDLEFLKKSPNKFRKMVKLAHEKNGNDCRASSSVSLPSAAIVMTSSDDKDKPVADTNSPAAFNGYRSGGNGRRLMSPYDGRLALNESEITVTSTKKSLLNYDTDTLRKSAQKNRETAARLMPKLQNKRNSVIRENNPSTKEEGSRKGGVSNGDNGRRRTQTSTSSGSRASSIFTDISGGGSTSSGASSYDLHSFHDILKEYHDQQRKQFIWHSIGNENFNSTCESSTSSSESPPLDPYSSNTYERCEQFQQESKQASESDKNEEKFRRGTAQFSGRVENQLLTIYAVPEKTSLRKRPSDKRTCNSHSPKVVTVCPSACSPPPTPTTMPSTNVMKPLSPPPLPPKSPPPLDSDGSSSARRSTGFSSLGSSSEENDSLHEDMSVEIDVVVVNQNSSSIVDEAINRRSAFSAHNKLNESQGLVKRPIVPVHPYKEKICNGKSPPINNSGSSCNVVQRNGSEENAAGQCIKIGCSSKEQHSTSPNSGSSFRPPVPPKPEHRIAKSPPQLPPKPTNFKLKRPDVMSASTEYLNGSSYNGKTAPKRPVSSVAEKDVAVFSTHCSDDFLYPLPRCTSVDFVGVLYDRGVEETRRNYRLTNETRLPVVDKKLIGSGDSCETDEKKSLILKITNKLAVLKKAYREVEQEIRYNDNVGHRLETLIENSDRIAACDKQKFRLHVEDTEKLAHLFLKLSSQLARIENDLDKMPATCSPKDKHHLTERRQRLMAQLADAKILKDDLDRRCESTTSMLRGVFSEEQIKDYEHFISLKSRLLVDAREIEDNIHLLDERRIFLEDCCS